MTRQRGFGVLFGLVAFALLALAGLFSTSSGISLGPIDGWIAGRPGIQDDLQAKTEARLIALGIDDAAVTMDGRDVTVDLAAFPNDLDAPALSSELLKTKGIRTVELNATNRDVAVTPQADSPTPAPAATAIPTAVPTAAPTPAPTAAAEEPVAANELLGRVDLGSIQLTGELQTNGQRTTAVTIVQNVPNVVVVDQIEVLGVQSQAINDRNVQAASLAIAILAGEYASGSVRLADEKITVQGTAADQPAADAITKAIIAGAASVGIENVQVEMSAPEEQIGDVVASLDLSGVNFESGTAQLRPDAFAILDQAATTLAGVTDVLIEVQGHTDSSGGSDINQALSEARATTVAEYLTSKGVEASILQARGYGAAQPIDDNQTEQGRAANRRVELIVIEGN